MNFGAKKSEPQQNVFSGMFSLLNKDLTIQGPSTLLLPNIFVPEGDPTDGAHEPAGRRLMKNTACPHTDKKHYAKNMCNNCYRSKGRKKLAWLCQHKERKLYARGRCQYCYIKHHNSVVVSERSRSRGREEDIEGGI